MLIQYVEDDPVFGFLVSEMFREDENYDLLIKPTLADVQSSPELKKTGFFLLDVNRPDTISIERDFEVIRELTPAPVAFVTQGDTSKLRPRALRIGAEAVIDKDELNSSLLRQLVVNARSRRAAELQEESMSENQVSSLRAPLDYLEFGLGVLDDIMLETGKFESREFVSHLRATARALKQYANEELSVQSAQSLNTLIEQIQGRIYRHALARDIGLRMDWEPSRFTQIGSNALAQLGVQHLLDGTLRCAGRGDGVWMFGEKDETTGDSVLKVHMSRPILPSETIFFPGGKSPNALGLDAVSSLQLGALLLSLSQEQVQLSSDGRQQLLSVNL